MKDKKTAIEIGVAAEKDAMQTGSLEIGVLSPFACPECHGVLSKITEGSNITRFRCHTGHAYSLDTLLASITEKVEDSLYNAIRGIDESVLLLNHVGDHMAEANQPSLAATYFKKAKEAIERAGDIKKIIVTHESLSNDKIMDEAGEQIAAQPPTTKPGT